MKHGDLHTTKNWRQIQAELTDELRKWEIDQYLLPYKDDSVRRGLVTVTVFIEGDERRLTCDRFSDGNWPERNYAAILLAVRSARLADQRGIGSLVAQAAQLKSLPDPDDPYHILGVRPSAGIEEIRAAYKQRMLAAHPDQGGSREGLERVMEAGRRAGAG